MRNRIGYLRVLYHVFNEDDFENKLKPITLLIKRNSTKDGFYLYRARRDWTPIVNDLSRAAICIAEGCWVEDTVEETLLHEMIHQYQAEVLGVAPNHDATFDAMAAKLEDKYEYDIR